MSRVYLAQSMAQREHRRHKEARELIQQHLYAAGHTVVELDYPRFNAKGYNGMQDVYKALHAISVCSRYITCDEDVNTLECRLERAWCREYGIPITVYGREKNNEQRETYV